MSSFTSRATTTTTTRPDPTKHVNYTMGMVLGVDDFTQEFAYQSGRDQWMARDLIGYGTVNGLAVSIEGEEVIVSPGVAVSPLGQMIRVCPAQCANLNKWLAIDKNRQELERRIGALLAGTVTLYVVLCYRDCPTDNVPIPGEPCRTEDQTVAPSRLKDDFKLELRFDSPEQCEEDALRDFVHWLRHHLEITDEPGSFATLEELIAAIRLAVAPLLQVSSPPCSMADFLFDSPPTLLRIHTADACEFLRAAFRLWTTELRPRWKPDYFGKAQGCAASPAEERPKEEECLLLAELRLPLTAGQVSDFSKVIIDETLRPYLLHLRFLQEWMLCGSQEHLRDIEAAHTFATLYIKDPMTIRAWLHHPLALDIPAGAVQIDIDDAPTSSPPQLTLITQPVPGINLFDLKLDAALRDGDRVTARFDADLIIEESNPPRALFAALGDLDYDYVDRDGHTLLAYLAVAYPALDDLKDVNAPAPQDGEVLTWQNDAWVAAAPNLGVTDHGALTGLENNDHPQYLLVDAATQALITDLDGGNRKVTNLAPGAGSGDAVIFQQAIKQNDPAGGDLSDTYPDPTVARIQGLPVNKQKPSELNPDDVLTWIGDAWEGRPPQAAANAVQYEPEPGLVTYKIVAAGIVDGRGGGRPPVYNKLSANATGTGRLTVEFSNYEDPRDQKQFQYIIKVLPVFNENTRALIVSFDTFQKTSFVLNVRDGGTPIPKELLSNLEFMIEVSRYDFR